MAEASAPAAAVLNARAGDVQALKACIAAQLAGLQLSVKPSDPKNPFGTPSVTLSLGEGTVVAEPNAVAAYLAGERVITFAAAQQRAACARARAKAAAVAPA